MFEAYSLEVDTVEAFPEAKMSLVCTNHSVQNESNLIKNLPGELYFQLVLASKLAGRFRFVFSEHSPCFLRIARQSDEEQKGHHAIPLGPKLNSRKQRSALLGIPTTVA